MQLSDIKAKNAQYLESLKIPVNKHLPTIESLAEVSPRTAQDVAKRACAMSYVVGLAFRADPQPLIERLKSYSLWDFVTGREKSLLEAEDVTQAEEDELGWLPEGIMALAWSLGLIEMDNFEYCSDDLASKFPFNVDPSDFITKVKLRPLAEIQAQSDLLYQMHWAAVHMRLKGMEMPFDEGVIYERRRAIDWVYGVEEYWEDIPMGT